MVRWARRAFITGAISTPIAAAASQIASPAIIWRHSGGNDYTIISDLGDEYNALARLRDGETLKYARKRYVRTRTLRFPERSFSIDAEGAHFYWTRNVKGVAASSGLWGPWRLLSPYVAGSTLLPPLGGIFGRLSQYLREGDPIKIVSNAIDPHNRNQGLSPAQYRIGEWAVVDHVDDGASLISITAPLRFPFGLNPASSGVDPERRETIASYTPECNARIVTPRNAMFRWTGGILEYEDGHDSMSGNGWRADVMHVDGYIRPEIEGLSIIRGYNKGIAISSFGASVRNTRVENLSDRAVIGGRSRSLGYGHVDWGSSRSSYIGIRGQYTRHLYTTAGPTTFADDNLPANLLHWGATTDASVSGGRCGSQRSTAFDTHADSRGTVFSDCVADGVAGFGFLSRGHGDIFVRPYVSGGMGVAVLQEWAQTSRDDLPAHSGNGGAALPLCTLEGADLTCSAPPLQLTSARMILRGVNRFNTRSPQIADTRGGLLYFDEGTHHFRVNQSASAAREPLVRCGPAPEVAGVDWIPGVIVGDGATVIVKYEGSTRRDATQPGSQYAASCSCVLDGTLKLVQSQLVEEVGSEAVSKALGMKVSGAGTFLSEVSESPQTITTHASD